MLLGNTSSLPKKFPTLVIVVRVVPPACYLMRLFLQLAFPQIIFRPAVRKRQDGPWLDDLYSGSEAIAEDLPLQDLVADIPKRVTKGVLDE